MSPTISLGKSRRRKPTKCKRKEKEKGNRSEGTDEAFLF